MIRSWGVIKRGETRSHTAIHALPVSCHVIFSALFQDLASEKVITTAGQGGAYL